MLTVQPLTKGPHSARKKLWPDICGLMALAFEGVEFGSTSHSVTVTISCCESCLYVQCLSACLRTLRQRKQERETVLENGWPNLWAYTTKRSAAFCWLNPTSCGLHMFQSNHTCSWEHWTTSTHACYDWIEGVLLHTHTHTATHTYSEENANESENINGAKREKRAATQDKRRGN